ncbi:MAG: hypothetical protein OEZ13_04940 [Spirochaetia bacterium]|nr:hypothetical protein [Spirochaetia bacterium]
MKVFLQQDFLKVPETPVTFIIVSAVLIGAAVIGYFIRNYFHSDISSRKALWHALRSYGEKQGLNHSHIALLKDFFNQLSGQMANKVVINQKQFQEILFSYLTQQKKVSAETGSLICEKLFAGQALSREINSARDLYISETCSITINTEHHLAKIVKIENDKVLLSVPGLNTAAVKPGKEAELFFYRERAGSYSIKSTVEKVSIDAVFLKITGFAVSKQDDHLMTDLLLPVHFKSWPPPANQEEKEIKLEGVTRKISDRSLLFLIKTENAEKILEANKIWEINLEIPKNFVFTSRGKIVPSKQKRGLYVFLYVDASEQVRERIFNFIKKSSPQRDAIY